MRSSTVSTKQQLEAAKNSKVDEIIVTGKLANDLKKTQKIAYASAGTIALLVAAIAAIPFTGGLSAIGGVSAISSGLVGGGAVAAMSGFEVAAIIVAGSLGITLIVAIFKDYEEISYKDGEMKLKKKS